MKRVSFKVRFMLVFLIVLAMFLLHNNFWSWQYDAAFPLIFGFIPFAFYYYITYAALATVAMYVIILLVWPDPPDDLLLPLKTEEDEKK